MIKLTSSRYLELTCWKLEREFQKEDIYNIMVLFAWIVFENNTDGIKTTLYCFEDHKVFY